MAYRLPRSVVRLALLGAASMLLFAVAGCGGGASRPDAGPDAGSDAARDADAARDSGPELPDGATLCEQDEECDDGVLCTRDLCDPLGYCRHPVDHAVCDDGVFCNGRERCDPTEGCVDGLIETCNDDEVCTVDRCDEEAKLCRHAPRDFDGDGEADFRCEGGTDCDDFDPTRGAELAELCEDGEDNDCDGTIDEADCGRPEHDTCSDPLDVSGGGTFVLSNEGAARNYDICASGADVVLQLTLSEARDVTVRAEGEGFGSTGVSLRRECGDPSTEVECDSGFPGEVRARSLEAGTYFLVVSHGGRGDIAVDVDLEPATEAPPNQGCGSPIDVSGGGVFEGSLVDVSDELITSCARLAQELVYELTLEEARDVDLSAVAETDQSMGLEVRTVCDDPTTAVRSAGGTPAGTLIHSLEPGTYYVIVEGSPSREVDFRLEVTLEEPTPVPEADSCATAATLTPGEPVTGTLSGKQNDEHTDCGFCYRDAVYSFELAERRDVTLVADGSGSFMRMAVRDSCEDEEAELRCVSGAPARVRLRNLAAGTYYVLVETFRARGFELSLEVSEPTVPVEVDGNDTCADAWVVPPTGGLFTGDTTTLLNDYETSSCGSGARSNDAAFVLELDSSKRVLATTEGSAYDTVLHVHQGMCVSEEERYCDDADGYGDTGLVDEVLEPGLWYFLVDGWGDGRVGSYFFEVLVSDP